MAYFIGCIDPVINSWQFGAETAPKGIHYMGYRVMPGGHRRGAISGGIVAIVTRPERPGADLIRATIWDAGHGDGPDSNLLPLLAAVKVYSCDIA